MLNRDTSSEEQRDARCGIKFIEHLLRIRNVQRIDYYFSIPRLFFSASAKGRLSNHVTNNKYKDLYFLSSSWIESM